MDPGAPVYTSRLAEGDKVRYVVWELTLRCDLSCLHCGSRAGQARSDELSTEECLAVAQQLIALGVEEVTLIGGEAYLHPGWLELIKTFRAASVTTTLVTGGRNLTEERILAAREAGIRAVSVSLDGKRPAHDALRGLEGSFEAAQKSLELLRKYEVPRAMNTQLNRVSIPDLEDLLELGITQELYGWQLQLTVAMGRAADHPELLLQPYELLSLMPRLASLSRRAQEHGILFWPGNNVGYFGPHQAELLSADGGPGFGAGCRAGQNTLGIEADGTVKGCPSLSTRAWAGGNLRTASLVALRETKALRYTRDRTVESLWGYCRTCYYADHCRAGCTWTGDVLFGRPGNNPYCHHRALELDRMGLRERLVLQQPAPGEPFDHGVFTLLLEASDTTPLPSQHTTPVQRRRLRLVD